MSAELRFYVLQPYQQVKDLRTGITSGNPTAILDEFLQASLAQRLGGADEAAKEAEAG